MTDARLFVASGLHAGASIALTADRDLQIGSAADADLILLDTGIAPHHASVRLHGNRLELRAAHADIAIFGKALKVGARTQLRHGATFRLGETALQFSNGAPPTEQAMKSAESAWLLAHAPFTWLRRKCARIPRYQWLAIAVVPLGCALLYSLNTLVPRPSEKRSSPLDEPAFRNVRQRADQTTGARVYEGYVQTAADLGAVSLVARARGGAVRVRVAVIDSMREQLSDFLDKYYRGVRLRAGERPGVFVATLPAADAYLQPESWDYARVDRLAQGQVDGLEALRFDGHENNSGPVRVPLEALGLNLLNSPHAAWLADQQGARYFAGAHLSIGRIERIDPCGASVIRDDGSIYVLIAQRTSLGKSC
ncbi:FHA domain-containing protein [Caballeronia sp. GAWG1-1]|uniref:FHA domain-containing protein n=1 Tax=Caballeronia sp. GAWG1-1 TaxID=2921742 RepID=UPI002027CC94|nr:FHA domain-containing protein [Caballeronia sp. GAWG1-1]